MLLLVTNTELLLRHAQTLTDLSIPASMPNAFELT